MEWNHWRIAGWGSFLLLLGLFLFAHPGRIDMIDGQYRFDVSRNILNLTGPDLSDYYLIQGALPRNPKTGHYYSYYTAPASLTPLPLMVVGRAIAGARVATDRFCFSLLSAFAGACILPLLLAFFKRLGFGLKTALGWSMVFALATLWWPGSETVFDQCQHGVAMLAMTLISYDVAKRGNMGMAVVAGLLGGLLFNYRTPYIALLPTIPVYWYFESKQGEGKAKFAGQAASFILGVAIGLAGYAFYNWVRFGSVSMPKFENGVSMVGNPVSGFLTLAVSPGKGFLWFSPPLILAIVGFKAFFKAERGLAGLVAAISILHVGEMSFLTFAGGDWCWGPRYLIPVMPLWALVFPYCSLKVIKPAVLAAVVGLGVLIQVTALSLDHHRFFFYRRLTPHFWLDPWVYFRYSQLLSRPAEIVESVEAIGRQYPKINASPNGEITYCPWGPPHRPESDQTAPPPGLTAPPSDLQKQIKNIHIPKKPAPKSGPKTYPDARTWQEQFSVFYLPRPWWGWINQVPDDQRPVSPAPFLVLCLLSTGIGAGLLRLAVKKDPGSDPGDKITVPAP